MFVGYVTLYSIGRFVIEGMRVDSLYLGQLRVAQLLSVLLFVEAISLIIYRRKMGKENYEDKSVIYKDFKTTQNLSMIACDGDESIQS